MASFVYEERFDLSPEQAYKTISLWLVGIKANIKDCNEPFYIRAEQGSFLKKLGNPLRRKVIEINITQKDQGSLGVIITVTASLAGKWRSSVLEKVKNSWEKRLFSQLWTILKKTKENDIHWQIKVTQFLIALPKVKSEKDFKRFTRKLCERCNQENLIDSEIQQITEALKLQLLTAKLFAPSKREKLTEWVGKISKSILGDVITDVISGALNSLVDYLIK